MGSSALRRLRDRRGSAAAIAGSLLSVLALGCAPPAARSVPGPSDGWTRLFDGETLAGWEGGNGLFRVEDGAIVGGTRTAPIARNEFLCTTQHFSDFDLRARFRLDAGGVNSGVQIRSERIPGSHEVIGYQADLGDGWWGALYDESRRKRLLVTPDFAAITPILDRTGWNDYSIHAEGGRIQIAINGHPTVDYSEPEAGIAQRGAICLQIHGGPPGEARFRDIEIREIQREAAAGSSRGFTRIPLSDRFFAEGANVGDFNRDRVPDLVAGPYWYEGPDFSTRHEYYAGKEFDREAYSDNFFAHAYDFNGDGWDDILIIGFPGEEARWYENPRGQPGQWPSHVVFHGVGNESPAWVDLTGDGRPEIVAVSDSSFGYIQPDWSDPSRAWTLHRITPRRAEWQKFTHGLGVGDMNGDGRLDLLEKDGWWEQPASLAGDPVWAKHAVDFGEGGAQMFTYDVDGDGDIDVITSLAAHGYGLAWFERVERKGAVEFVRHLIMNQTPAENPYGVAFSQVHAIELVDMNGDGLQDIVTGKRRWAHGTHGDPEPNGTPVIYWFELVRRTTGGADFIPHLVDDQYGVGVQVTVADVNGDGLPDVLSSNKTGTVILLQKQ